MKPCVKTESLPYGYFRKIYLSNFLADHVAVWLFHKPWSSTGIAKDRNRHTAHHHLTSSAAEWELWWQLLLLLVLNARPPLSELVF